MKKDQYIISGSGYRLLIWDLYSFFVAYITLARQLSKAKTEKDFKRLQKRTSSYEKWAEKHYRRWGISKNCESFACDTLENAITEKYLTPVSEDAEDTDL